MKFLAMFLATVLCTSACYAEGFLPYGRPLSGNRYQSTYGRYSPTYNRYSSTRNQPHNRTDYAQGVNRYSWPYNRAGYGYTNLNRYSNWYSR